MLTIHAFLLTLILGPMIFYWMGKFYYKKKKLRTYPLYVVDGVGDTVFLPLFNALIVAYGIRFVNPYLSVAMALAITVGWMTYRLFWEKTTDWSMPRIAHLSFGGWYHLAFFFVQSFLIVSGIIEFYDKIWIWLPLIAYLLGAVYSLGWQVPRFFKKN